MSQPAEQVYACLEALGIPFRRAEHPAVHTMEELLALELPECGAVAKNLFLRDDRKRNYYLLALRPDRRADLKALGRLLGSRPLSFASPGDLKDLLGLEAGAVTPFGALNDGAGRVQVLLDAALWEGAGTVGVHPNENTATVWLRTEDLVRVLEARGHPVLAVRLDGGTKGAGCG